MLHRKPPVLGARRPVVKVALHVALPWRDEVCISVVPVAGAEHQRVLRSDLHPHSLHLRRHQARHRCRLQPVQRSLLLDPGDGRRDRHRPDGDALCLGGHRSRLGLNFPGKAWRRGDTSDGGRASFRHHLQLGLHPHTHGAARRARRPLHQTVKVLPAFLPGVDRNLDSAPEGNNLGNSCLKTILTSLLVDRPDQPSLPRWVCIALKLEDEEADLDLSARVSSLFLVRPRQLLPVVPHPLRRLHAKDEI